MPLTLREAEGSRRSSGGLLTRWPTKRISASVPLMLPRELGRLVAPISELWSGRGGAAPSSASDCRIRPTVRHRPSGGSRRCATVVERRRRSPRRSGSTGQDHLMLAQMRTVGPPANGARVVALERPTPNTRALYEKQKSANKWPDCRSRPRAVARHPPGTRPLAHRSSNPAGVIAIGVKRQRLSDRRSGRRDLHPWSQWYLGTADESLGCAEGASQPWPPASWTSSEPRRAPDPRISGLCLRGEGRPAPEILRTARGPADQGSGAPAFMKTRYSGPFATTMGAQQPTSKLVATAGAMSLVRIASCSTKGASSARASRDVCARRWWCG